MSGNQSIVFVAAPRRRIIAEGEYVARGVDIRPFKYRASPKLEVVFEVDIPNDEGDMETVQVSRFYNLSRNGKYTIGPRTALRRELEVAVGNSIAGDAEIEPWAVFVGRAFRVRVRTVTHDGAGSLLEERDQYSAVDELLYPEDVEPLPLSAANAGRQRQSKVG